MKSLSFVITTLSILLFTGAHVMAATGTVTLTFSDVSSNHPNAMAIAVLQSQGVVSGDKTTGNFVPGRVLNRAEFAKMIVQAKGWSTAEVQYTSVFKDVPNGQWFTPYILKAYEQGVIKGTPEGNAEPGRSVLMAEALAMTLRAFGATIAEASAGSAWYTPYINAGKADGILDASIKTSFNGGLPRAEAAQTIVNALVKYQKLVLPKTLTRAEGASRASATSTATAEIFINNKKLSAAQISAFASTYGSAPVAGRYWYDSRSGLAGPECDGVRWFMRSGENFGTLLAKASCGTTGVFLNGRELPQNEYSYLMNLVGAFPAGRYFLDANGDAGVEGSGFPLVNLLSIAAQSSGGGGGGSSFYRSSTTDTGSGSSGGSGYVMGSGWSVSY